jgi:fluoride exporter
LKLKCLINSSHTILHMNSRIIFLVGAGGFIGSIGRYLSQQLVGKYLVSSFPFGTFFVNIIGCFLIGLVYGISEKNSWMSPEWRLFLATGVCGGYTTFSAFSFESLNLLRDANYISFAVYVSLSVILCIAATLLGVFITKQV